MAIDRGVLELLDGLRLSINQALEAHDRAMLASWARAWTEVSAEWDLAVADLISASKSGAWPTHTQVMRADRAKRALALTRDALIGLAGELQVTVSQSLPRLVAEAVDWELRLMMAQLPPTSIRTAELIAGFNRLDPVAINAIVARTTRRVTALSRPIPAYVDTVIRSTLVRGVIVGDNPVRAARIMRQRIGSGFDLGRVRSLVISRTEMLDAHRAGSLAVDKANRSVTAKWQWVANLDSRTCIACVVMHGQEFPVTTEGPLGHQQCRCTRVPVLKSWDDLGFDLEEPPDLLPDGKAWFDSLPESEQLAIAGRARLDAYRNGTAGWDDLASRRTTRDWRDSFIPTPPAALAS